jgi:hypothetical protein
MKTLYYYNQQFILIFKKLSIQYMETDSTNLICDNIRLINDIDYLLETISYNDIHILKSNIC